VLIANDIVEMLFSALCCITARVGHSLVPRLSHFQLHEDRGQPGIFPHMCDVKGKKVVERT